MNTEVAVAILTPVILLSILAVAYFSNKSSKN